VRATGDLDVDQHHTVEDVGLMLGAAVREAVGDQRGTLRSGWWVMPMDEALALVAIDLGGRAHCQLRGAFTAPAVGTLDTGVIEDFFQGFAQAALANVHVVVLAGRSAHHQVEAVFKAFARALRTATTTDRQLQKVLPSTKGML
jgi:imidazoleglycerol-phosphate dehydratase